MSPKNVTPRRRQRAGDLKASSSFFGKVANIVSTPLSWLTNAGGYSDEIDHSGKRRPLGDVEPDDQRGSTKRMRITSPDRELPPPPQPQFTVTGPGYLDPPVSAFHEIGHISVPTVNLGYQPSVSSNLRASPSKSIYGPASAISPTNGVASALGRMMSIDPPSAKTAPKGLNPSRLARSGSSAMVVDPPSANTSYSAANRSLARQLTRDVSMTGTPVSPTKADTPAGSPFILRKSLTPSASMVHRAKQEASRPPLVSSLMSNPMFVRTPSMNGSTSTQYTTLGSIVSSQRATGSPIRQINNIAGMQSAVTTVSPPPEQGGSAAERALHELDIYKTPLLPTRLQGSTTIPDMFRPPVAARRAVKMTEKEERKKLGDSGLGKKGKGKMAEKEKAGAKPYAGSGGMKKLLARRKLEEQEARLVEEKQKVERKEADEELMEEEDIGEERVEERKTTGAPALVAAKEIPEKREPAPKQPAAGPASTLRIGRVNTSRSHVSSARKKGFAAPMDEDADAEEEEGRRREREFKELEEAAKKAPVFNIPAGFSFAKNVAPPPQDISKAKEPPISSLPFSFGGGSSNSTSSTPPLIPTLQPETTKQPAAATPSLPASSFFGTPAPTAAPPFISLQPPTPANNEETAKFTPTPASEPLKTTSGIPNLFASSPAPAAAPKQPTSGSVPNFFANSPALAAAPAANPTLQAKASIPDFFAKPAAASPAPTKDAENPFWMGEKKEELAKEAPKPAATSLFGGVNSAFGGVPPSTSTLFSSTMPAPAAPSNPAEPTASLFGAPPKPNQPSASLFESVEPNGVASPSVTAPEPPKLSTPAFSFGQPTSGAPAVDAPKPLFPASTGFSFGGNTDITSPIQKEEASPAPFAFATASSTAPVVEEKKPAGLGFGSATPGPFSFGGGGSNGADVSKKPFSFGAAAVAAAAAATPNPPRPVTPPRNEDQEFRMEESPTRDMQVNSNADTPKPSGFSFNTNPSSIFGSNNSSNAAPAGFSFSATSSSTSPFAPKVNTTVTESKPNFGGLSPSPAPAAFTFGQPAASNDGSRPSSSAGGFAFGQSPTSATEARPSSSGFNFSQPTNTTNTGFGSGFGAAPVTTSNPFGAPANANSAPSSPGLFGQTQPSAGGFNFNAPVSATSTTNPFSFGGSQPASPAVANPGLPSATPTTPSTNGPAFSFGATTSPTTLGGSSLFNMGAPPAQAPPAGGRRVKGLPNRRTTGRR